MSKSLVFPIRSDRLSMTAQVRERIYHEKTEFQSIEIVDTFAFGRALLLDGHIQLTEFDEAAYHESLVQIPLMALTEAKSALVVGGGDGGVLRELVKHPKLERIDMVEIDRGVVDACRAHLEFLSNGAFDDPRVNLRIADAFPFVKQVTEPYDLIVVDSTDTYEDEEGEISEMLFTAEFYADCRNALTENGLVVTQADNLVFCPYSLEEILKTFDSVFPKTGSYQAVIPSFGGFSGFAWGSRGVELPGRFEASVPMTYLNETTHALAFHPFCFGAYE